MRGERRAGLLSNGAASRLRALLICAPGRALYGARLVAEPLLYVSVTVLGRLRIPVTEIRPFG